MSEDKTKTQQDLQRADFADSIIKVYHPNDNFTMVQNSLLQNFGELSFATIGLISYLRSMKKDWVFHKTWIYNNAKDGRRRIDTAWKEAVDKNYILQFQKRNGKLNQYIYYVNDIPFNREQVIQISQFEDAVPLKKFNQFETAIQITPPTDADIPEWSLDDDEKYLNSLDPREENHTQEESRYDYRVDEISKETSSDSEKTKVRTNLSIWQDAFITRQKAGGVLAPINAKDLSMIKYAVVMTKINFTKTTLLQQFDRFTKTFTTNGISPLRIVDYFMTGLYELQTVALHEIYKNSDQQDIPTIPMHDWTKD